MTLVSSQHTCSFRVGSWFCICQSYYPKKRIDFEDAICHTDSERYPQHGEGPLSRLLPAACALVLWLQVRLVCIKCLWWSPLILFIVQLPRLSLAQWSVLRFYPVLLVCKVVHFSSFHWENTSTFKKKKTFLPFKNNNKAKQNPLKHKCLKT